MNLTDELASKLARCAETQARNLLLERVALAAARVERLRVARLIRNVREPDCRTKAARDGDAAALDEIHTAGVELRAALLDAGMLEGSYGDE